MSHPFDLSKRIQVAEKTHRYLKAIGSRRAEEFREICRQRFTDAETFTTVQEMEALKKEITKGLIPAYGPGEES